MSIQPLLKEAVRCLNQVVQSKGSCEPKLANAIGHAISALANALAIADPDKAWVAEVKREAWQAASPAGSPYDKLEPHNLIMCDRLARFAASVAAGELEKCAKRLGIDDTSNSNLFNQIHDLEAIAKGGGE